MNKKTNSTLQKKNVARNILYSLRGGRCSGRLVPLIIGLMLTTVFSYGVRSSLAVMLDHEGSKPYTVTVTDLTNTGHTFTKGSTKRTYTFDVDYRVTDTGDVAVNTERQTSCKTVWNGSSNQFSVTCGHVAQVVYKCDHRDPVLGDKPDVNQCTVVSSHINDGMLERDLNHYFQKSCLNDIWAPIGNAKRMNMRLEALAKSISLVSPGDVQTPESGFLLMVNAASDVVVPKGWKIDFYVKSSIGGNSSGGVGVIHGKWSRNLTAGPNFIVVKDVFAPGNYTFQAEMMTSLTSKYISDGVPFKIFPNNTSSKNNETHIITLGEKPEFHTKDELYFFSPTSSKVSSDPVAVELDLPDNWSSTDRIIFKASWQYIAKDGGASSFPRPFQIIGDASGYPLDTHFVETNHFQMGMPADWLYKLKPNEFMHPGEYKLKAILVRDGKEKYSQETKGWFTINDHSSQMSQIGSFQIYSPAKGDVYIIGQTVPVRVSLPENIMAGSKLEIKLWHQKNESTAVKLLRKETVDNIEMNAGTVFEYPLHLNKSGLCWVSVDLITSSTQTVKSGKFSVLEGTEAAQLSSIVLAAPDENRTYTDVVPVNILLPNLPSEEEAYKDFQWSLELIWKVQLQQNVPGLELSMDLATQKFVYLVGCPAPADTWDGLDSVPLSRTWASDGMGTVHRLSFAIPVKNILAKAGRPGAIVTLEARLLDHTKIMDSKSRSFQVALPSNQLGDAWTSSEKKSATLLLDSPIILTPSENQAFLFPAKVNVDLIHAPDKKVVTELQYAPFGKKKRDILLFESLNPTSVTRLDEGNKTTLTYALKKTGFYRIRAKHNDKDAKWTNWRKFKVDTFNMKLASTLKPVLSQVNLSKKVNKSQPKSQNQIPGLQHGIQTSQTKKQDISGIISKNGINPQPEPPGKQMHTMDMPLQIMPVSRSYRAPAKVKITLKNAVHSRIPFELGYRPSRSGTYRTVQHPQHTFSRTNGKTNLTLSLKEAGQYRVRFRKNHKAPWTQWLPLQVTENLTDAIALGKKLRISPIAARAINPQPEPPGKQIRPRTTVRNKGKIHPLAQPQRNQVRQMQLPAPVIRKPGNGQKFMLTAKSMHIKAEITHAAGQKIQVEVQHEQQRRYLPLKTGIRTHQMKDRTTVDILVSNTGNYRLRIKDTSKRSHWSKWTTFYIDKVMKNMPHTDMNKPAHTILVR